MDKDFEEDKKILDQLADPVDIEAFSNLMEYAHSHNQSAASLIREEPNFTSRSLVRKLCMKDKKRVLGDYIRSFVRKMAWVNRKEM